jgi:predicted dehydrogenase
MEIQLTEGSISLVGDQYAGESAASFFVRAGAPAVGSGFAVGWNHGLTPPPPADNFPLIGRGAEHFINCVAGKEKPILTAEHARHVLEIVLLAYESIADGRTWDLTTTFSVTSDL